MGRIKICSRIEALTRPYHVVVFGQHEADITALTRLMADEYDSVETPRRFHRALLGQNLLHIYPSTAMGDMLENEQEFLRSVQANAYRLAVINRKIDVAIYCAHSEVLISAIGRNCRFIHSTLLRNSGLSLHMVTVNWSRQGLVAGWWDSTKAQIETETNGLKFVAHGSFFASHGSEDVQGERSKIAELLNRSVPNVEHLDTRPNDEDGLDEDFGNGWKVPESLPGPDEWNSIKHFLVEQAGLPEALAQQAVPKLAPLELQRYVSIRKSDRKTLPMTPTD